MKPAITTFAQMRFVVNAERINYKELYSIIEYNFFATSKINEAAIIASKKKARRYSYIIYSYARNFKGENIYSHFNNLCGNLANAVREHNKILNPAWIINICEEYCDYVRSFR